MAVDDAKTTVADYAAAVGDLIEIDTDGFPVILPHPEGVDAMVAATGRAADEVLGSFGDRPVTVGDVAEQALMAGCLPEYMAIVVPVYEILLDPLFGTMRWATAEGGYFPWVIVNGPQRRGLGINAKHNVMGPGFRANATIGRAIRLGLMNLAGIKPGSGDRSTIGTAWKFAAVLAEDEEDTPWPPLHTTLGYAPDDSTVTVVVGRQPRHVTHQLSSEPDALLSAYAEEANTEGHYSSAPDADDPLFDLAEADARATRGVLVVVGEDHRGYFEEAGWDRARMQAYLHRILTRTAGELRAAGIRRFAEGMDDADRLDLVASPARCFVVASGSGGGRGQTGLVFGNPVTKRIEAPTPVAAAEHTSPIASSVASVNKYFDRGVTDGHPIVPPFASGLQEMLAAAGRDADQPLGRYEFSDANPTVKDVALNALMAGAKPEYMPVILTIMDLLVGGERGAGLASTGSHWPTVLVNGPVRKTLGIASHLGPGARANATIGRAVLLTSMNVGRFRPALLDKSAVGNAEKYNFAVIGENEEDSPWEPLHVAMGFQPEDSTVMLLGDHSKLVINTEATSPDEVCRSFVSDMTTIQRFDAPSVGRREAGQPTRLGSFGIQAPFAGAAAGGGGGSAATVLDASAPARPRGGGTTVYVGGTHREIFRRAAWTRRQVQDHIVSLGPGRAIGDIRRSGYDGGRILPEQLDDEFVPITLDPESIVLFAAGGPGGYSFLKPAAFGGGIRRIESKPRSTALSTSDA
ncbi:MAG: hypothetical protein GEU74_12095 [Nitriliruptorales bacterium]|nr:hypothetical protein [Nitriliruptorales bacterium]